MAERTIGIVGAGGFVGQALARAVAERGVKARLFNRGAGSAGSVFEPLPSSSADLRGVDVMVHLAAIAHQRIKGASYQGVNIDLPLSMADLAVGAGVSRFVFISSLTVHGPWSPAPIAPDSPFAPTSPYAESKVQAERRLAERLAGTGVELGVIRPPLVYGPGVKGNFRALMRAAGKGLPLPLGRADAPRTLVSSRNLADAILHLGLSDAEAPGAVLIPGDDRDLTVHELYAVLGSVAGRTPPQVSVPVPMMRLGLSALGKAETFDSLFRSAVVDRAHWAALGWRPVQTVEKGLADAVA